MRIKTELGPIDLGKRHPAKNDNITSARVLQPTPLDEGLCSTFEMTFASGKRITLKAAPTTEVTVESPATHNRPLGRLYSIDVITLSSQRDFDLYAALCNSKKRIDLITLLFRCYGNQFAVSLTTKVDKSAPFALPVLNVFGAGGKLKLTWPAKADPCLSLEATKTTDVLAKMRKQGAKSTAYFALASQIAIDRYI